MKNYKIVVAESDDNHRRNIMELLKKRGYEVYKASDTGSVLRITRSIIPDLVIMDINLSGNNAYKTAQIIEKDKVSSVIFSTSNLNSTFYEKLENMNIFAYIIKPVNLEQLYHTVEFSINNINKVENLRKKIELLETQLDNRKKIEKAKGIVMDKLKISEEQAYKFLRKKSMDACTSIEKIADRIIQKYG